MSRSGRRAVGLAIAQRIAAHGFCHVQVLVGTHQKRLNVLPWQVGRDTDADGDLILSEPNDTANGFVG